jgi:ketosteroid isomerase-like protein
MPNPPVTTQTLEAFSAAWNAHDIDALMSFMAPNCIFETVSGTNVFGNRFEGQDAVRTAFESAWKNFPDAQWLNGKHFVAGDRGVSEWLFVGTGLDGKRVEANGVDIFTFADGKILVKNAFRKMRT